MWPTYILFFIYIKYYPICDEIGGSYTEESEFSPHESWDFKCQLKIKSTWPEEGDQNLCPHTSARKRPGRFDDAPSTLKPVLSLDRE